MPEQVQSLENIIANRYGIDPTKFKSTLIKTCFPADKQNVSDEQYTQFLVVVNEHELNPFTREIFAFPQGNTVVPTVGVDGWSKLINEHPMMNGIEFDEVFDDVGTCTAITATVYRKDRGHPTKITEYMSECKRGNFGPWKTHPIRMLRHKTLIQAARVTFGFAGIYDQDEAERILEATAITPLDDRPKTQRLVEQLKSATPPEVTDAPEVVEEVIVPEQIAESVTPESRAIDSDLGSKSSRISPGGVATVPSEKPRQRKSKKTEAPTSSLSESEEFDEAGKALYDKTGDGKVRGIEFPKRLLRTDGEPPTDLTTLVSDEMSRIGQPMSKLDGFVKNFVLVEEYKTLSNEAVKCLIKVLEQAKSKA